MGLGIRQPTLQAILQEKTSIADRQIDMLTAWLNQQGNVQQYGLPSWKVLVDAVRNLNPALAAQIENSAPW